MNFDAAFFLNIFLDFPEFCRYIIMQAELVLNFFYHKYYKTYGGMLSVLSVISQYNISQNGNQYFKPNDNIVSVEDIPLKKILKSLGLNLKEDGSIPFIDKVYYSMKKVKEYQFELFLYKQSFDSLERSLAILVDSIHNFIKYSKST